MQTGSRDPMPWLRGLAWVVLALMLGAGLYSAWVTVINFDRISV